MKSIKFVGLDVYAETMAVAVAEQGGEVRSLGVIPNREESIRKLRGKVKGKVVTAIGRELLGFIWAIGVQAEAVQKKTEQRAA